MCYADIPRLMVDAGADDVDFLLWNIEGLCDKRVAALRKHPELAAALLRDLQSDKATVSQAILALKVADPRGGWW